MSKRKQIVLDCFEVQEALRAYFINEYVGDPVKLTLQKDGSCVVEVIEEEE